MNATATKNIPADIIAELTENADDGYGYTTRTVRGVSKVDCEVYGVRYFFSGVRIDRDECDTYYPWSVGSSTFENMAAAKAYIMKAS